MLKGAFLSTAAASWINGSLTKECESLISLIFRAEKVRLKFGDWRVKAREKRKLMKNRHGHEAYVLSYLIWSLRNASCSLIVNGKDYYIKFHILTLQLSNSHWSFITWNITREAVILNMVQIFKKILTQYCSESITWLCFQTI